MATYVYDILGEEGMKRDFVKWESRRKAAGKAPRKLLRFQETLASLPLTSLRRRTASALRPSLLQPLRRVKTWDKLYILAHGAPRRICSVLTGREYLPEQLAEHLEQVGLVKNFRDLRIAACHSGERQSVERRGEDGQMFTEEFYFIGKLRNAMVARGYYRIRVGGYRGNYVESTNIGTEQNPEYHSAIVFPPGQQSQRAHLHRVFEGAEDI